MFYYNNVPKIDENDLLGSVQKLQKFLVDVNENLNNLFSNQESVVIEEQEAITPETITTEKIEGFEFTDSTSGTIGIYKFGDIVTINFNITFNGNIRIGTLPQEVIPKTSIWNNLWVLSSSVSARLLVIESSGTIIVAGNDGESLGGIITYNLNNN